MIDIIICTYNRPQKIVELVQSLFPFKASFNRIIVVDSSDATNKALEDIPEVLYLVTKIKNQPYQRYLGYSISKADFLLYLDDDMEIANRDFLIIIKETINKHTDLAGIAICFDDKHSQTTLSVVPKSVFFNRKYFFYSCVRTITFYPILPNGHLGFCGVRGKQPEMGGDTQWLSGGAFLAKREYLFNNFNFQLFDLFQEKLGMGEDAIIGYGLSKQGKLIYLPELLFFHNDQRDSSYSLNQYEFAQRVMYSRLYLSLEKNRLDGGNYFYPLIYFHCYAFFRIAGLVLNYILTFENNRKEILKGSFRGWMRTFSFKWLDLNTSRLKWNILDYQTF